MNRALFILLLLLLLNNESRAEGEAKVIPMEADFIECQKETEETICNAKGKVKVVYENNTLIADKVTYFSKQDKVIAEGNVEIIEASGIKLDGKKMILTDGFKRGVIESFKVKFPDDSYLEAKTGVKESDSVTKLSRAMFTSCKFICGKTEPIWKVRAKEAKFDQEKEEMSYKNATFDVYGIPVFYTPYFTHPTPKSKRKSGILRPVYEKSNYLGHSITIPYYVNVAPNKDVTITEQYTTLRGSILLGEYRHLTTMGSYSISGSATKRTKKADDQSKNSGSKINQLRGHLYGNGHFLHSDEWNSGFNIKLTTDKTYLDNYNYKKNVNAQYNNLTSKIYANKFDDRTVMKINSIYFQNLDPETKYSISDAPIIMPVADLYHETESYSNGSKFILTSNLLSLQRNGKVDDNKIEDIKRFSSTIKWELPKTFDSGHVVKLSSFLRGDLYHYKYAANSNYKKSTNRAIPGVMLDWKYPLVASNKSKTLIVEPLASIVLNPQKNYNKYVVNEDSQVLELSDSNLFSPTFSSGYDLIEYGPRFNYGLKSSLYDDKTKASFMIGQSYMKQNLLEQGKNNIGFSKKYSDFVGRISLSYNDKTEISYRYLMDRKTYKLLKNEVIFNQNLHPLYLEIEYTGFSDSIMRGNSNNNSKQVYAKASVKRYKNWNYSANIRSKLGKRKSNNENRIISFGGEVEHFGQCINQKISMSRKYTKSPGIKSSTTYLYSISFKNLT